ncbi:Winged helix-turn-helix transcription repressor DNA-binding [Penicillium concentricum]|uniref:Winged helix-turn-helix transcription repressor DNA-binding n=1 Tax=Penicillium concentricum TaxID=293559 RepID=A0A9W9SCD0_9EURO|nr:Winged helix-turn-helix transcription repressor DNA-binding [Penicillium concentricum]KAJ5375405.1 Winged helix-turn-helix transcription repressor DNA-binding [Penicillium concentricum]
MDKIEETLTELVKSLIEAKNVLQCECRAELMARLHNSKTLPERELYELSRQATQLLHEIELLLEPRPMILANYFLGSAKTKCLNAAVELNIPDLLKAGPMDVATLASVSKARPDRLKQVMRVLCSDSVFEFDTKSQCYSLNECSELLLTDHWTRWWHWVDLYGNEFYEMARGIPAACREEEMRMPSQIAFDTELNMFRWHCAGLSLGEVADGKTTVMDIGGGGGGLISALLRAAPNLQGGVFDLPEVIDHATENFHGTDGIYRDVGSRVAGKDLHKGDFFQSIPSYEVYTMKWCLHDWNDCQVVQILSNIRKAIILGPKSRLVLLEIILRDGHAGNLSRLADLSVFMAASGMERDEGEWRDLARKGGWKIQNIYHLRSAWPEAMELIPA